MKKIIIWFIIFLLWINISFWDEDNSWEETIKTQEKVEEEVKVKKINDSFNLTKFESEWDFGDFIKNKFFDKIINSCYYSNPYQEPIKYKYNIYKDYEDDVSFWDLLGDTEDSLDEDVNTIQNTSESKEIEFSTTNLQKKLVDEPEIVKNTKWYIFYYSKNNSKIYITKTPISNNKLNLETAKLVKTINVPKMIRNDIKLFANDTRLTVIWTRNSNYWNISERTNVLVFDISDLPNVKLLKFFETKWTYFDARVINSKLYTISNYSLSNLKNEICNTYYKQPLKEKAKEYINLNSLKYISDEKFSEMKKKQKSDLIFKKDFIIGKIKKQTFEKYIDLSYNKNSALSKNWKTYPYDIEYNSTKLENVFYIPNDFKNVSISSSKLNIISTIDIDSMNIKPKQTIVWWNLDKWQIHMTTESLYLVNNYSKSSNYACPELMLCAMPIFESWKLTLVHKLDIDNWNFKYNNSTIVPWTPINQYAMDEDSAWNFRIFLAQKYDNKDVSLYNFDKNLKLVWKLEDIEPTEQFKSSRFIWNKAYLVTFKATDPLFVIDLEDIKNPKVVWELKIPWYSLYLHPYWSEKDWKQYLIWIWQEAEEISEYRSLPKNVKIDLYEIDYNEKTEEQIKVIQKFSYILWKETEARNGWSYTPIFDNPRSFVWDSKNKRLILPAYLVERIWKPYFMWLKWLEIDKDNWIKEVISKNYLKTITKSDYYSQYNFKNLDFRTWYYSDWIKQINFLINNKFLDLFQCQNNKTIIFWDNAMEEIKDTDLFDLDCKKVDQCINLDETNCRSNMQCLPNYQEKVFTSCEEK